MAQTQGLRKNTQDEMMAEQSLEGQGVVHWLKIVQGCKQRICSSIEEIGIRQDMDAIQWSLRVIFREMKNY